MPKLETSGYKAWWPMLEAKGRRRTRDGRRIQIGQEVLRNMDTGQVFASDKGWDAEPPCPSGELLASCRHLAYGNDEFWDNMAKNRDHTVGEVIVNRPGRLVIRY